MPSGSAGIDASTARLPTLRGWQAQREGQEDATHRSFKGAARAQPVPAGRQGAHGGERPPPDAHNPTPRPSLPTPTITPDTLPQTFNPLSHGELPPLLARVGEGGALMGRCLSPPRAPHPNPQYPS